jgi:hypothetical protein
MTSAEIASELRATRPTAPIALRTSVLDAARQTPLRSPSHFDRLRWRLPRGLIVLLPAAAAAAVAIAVAVGVTGTDSGREATQTTVTDRALTELAPEGTVADSAAGSTAGTAPPVAKVGGSAGAIPAVPAPDRAQRVSASLVLRVDDGEALSAATRDALRITRSLDGYVVRSAVVSGDDGIASLSLRVPTANAQDAIARLSALGTIVGQQVVADDLQGQLDALASELVRLRTQLATVRARLDTDDLTTAERAALRARRDMLVATLAGTRQQHTATKAQAAEATIDLEIRTSRSSGVIPVSSRLDRTLGQALDVLAWEAVVLLGLVVVLAPIALLGALLWGARRTATRRANDRVLAS